MNCGVSRSDRGVAILIKNIIDEVDRLPSFHEYGQVASVLGMLVEVSGAEGILSIGDHCRIKARHNRVVLCEVIGFRENRALVMPFGTLEGIGLGCAVEINTDEKKIVAEIKPISKKETEAN